EMFVEALLVVVDGTAHRAAGQVGVELVALGPGQLVAVGRAELKHQAGVTAIHWSPSSASRRPASPRPRGAGARVNGPWLAPGATSRYRLAGPSAPQCRGNQSPRNNTV